ncbi:MAG: septum site-determining protein MinD [Roseburia sp.]
MGEVITFTSGKGGVGKTTTTANVGVGLSLFDKKVVLVDTDIGLRNLDVVMGLENRILYNLVDILKGKCRMRQALIRDKRYPNLSMIPSPCVKERETLDLEQMKVLLASLKEEFDYILIDSPAGIDQGFYLSLCDTDRAVVVTTPQITAIHDADRVLQLIRREKIKEVNLIINSYRRNMVKNGDMLDVADISELLDTELIGVVPEDPQIVIAQNHGTPVIGQHTPSEKYFLQIAKRILGEDVPIAEQKKRQKLFTGFFIRKNSGEICQSGGEK